MADLSVKAGDKGKYLTFYCTEPVYVNGVWDGKTTAVKDLTNLTIKFQAWVPGVATPAVNGSCTVVGNPTDGVCQYLLTGTDFPSKAFYEIQLQYSVANTLIDSSQTYTLQVLESG